MMLLRRSVFVLLFGLTSCSATPITIPGSADSGIWPATDAHPNSQPDASMMADRGGEPVLDNGVGPVPCGDGGDAACADAGPGDAMGEGLIDGGADGDVEAGPGDGSAAEMGPDCACVFDASLFDLGADDLAVGDAE